jgi:hypothetical protein
LSTEDAQLRVRATIVEKLKEAIDQGVLVVCVIHEEYLHVLSDYAHDSCHVNHQR